VNNSFVFSESDGSKLEGLKIFWDTTPGTASMLGFKTEENTYLPSDGDYGAGNNDNALLAADIQFTNVDMAQWLFIRGQEAVSTAVKTYPGGYYEKMLSSLGITSSQIHQGEEFGNIMVEEITERRDSISGVSLDEELIKLMVFQQSYAAASKLIKTVDEMLLALMAVK